MIREGKDQIACKCLLNFLSDDIAERRGLRKRTREQLPQFLLHNSLNGAPKAADGYGIEFGRRRIFVRRKCSPLPFAVLGVRDIFSKLLGSNQLSCPLILLLEECIHRVDPSTIIDMATGIFVRRKCSPLPFAVLGVRDIFSKLLGSNQLSCPLILLLEECIHRVDPSTIIDMAAGPIATHRVAGVTSQSRGWSRSHRRRTRSRGPTRFRSRTPAPEDKVSWADTIRGTAREGVGKAPKVPDQNQTADNGIIEALRKENSAMRELLQKLMHEVHELRRERAAAEQNKQPEQPKAQASVPDAGAPAPKKRALQQRTCEGGSESQYVRCTDACRRAATRDQATIKGSRLTLIRLEMANDNQAIVIWQWNCRGFAGKKAGAISTRQTRRGVTDTARQRDDNSAKTRRN
ncbi:hypothetical protein HPB50_028076 [Hyalomma asiaticum]|nr:hypothetical protein HPB50_028076 [Hyalomma asiaticum]